MLSLQGRGKEEKNLGQEGGGAERGLSRTIKTCTTTVPPSQYYSVLSQNYTPGRTLAQLSVPISTFPSFTSHYSSARLISRAGAISKPFAAEGGFFQPAFSKGTLELRRLPIWTCQSLSGSYPMHPGISLQPSGNKNPANIQDYLELKIGGATLCALHHRTTYEGKRFVHTLSEQNKDDPKKGSREYQFSPALESSQRLGCRGKTSDRASNSGWKRSS